MNDPRPMRRKDRETTQVDVCDLLAKGEYGVLSTSGPDGLPYGVPVSYVFRDGVIYFHSAPEGRKVDNLADGTPASFCVVGATEILPGKFSTRYESAIASGEVLEVTGEAKGTALQWLIEKYAPDFLRSGAEYIAAAQDKTRVFSILVQHLSGKRRR